TLPLSRTGWWGRSSAHPFQRVGPPAKPWHAQRRKEHLGLVAVVASAAKLYVLDRRFASRRIGVQVVELQEATLVATAPGSSDEGATVVVPRRDRPSHLGRNISGVG